MDVVLKYRGRVVDDSDVAFIRGSRVDHVDRALANDVCVCPLQRHRPRVWRDDAKDLRMARAASESRIGGTTHVPPYVEEGASVMARTMRLELEPGLVERFLGLAPARAKMIPQQRPVKSDRSRLVYP